MHVTGRHDANQSVLVALLQLRKGVRGSFVLLALIVVVALLEQRLAHMPGWSPGHVVNYMPGWQWPCPGRPVQLQHVCVLLTQTSVIISSEVLYAVGNAFCMHCGWCQPRRRCDYDRRSTCAPLAICQCLHPRHAGLDS